MGVERHRFLSSLRSVGESLERSAGSFDYEIDGGTAYQMALGSVSRALLDAARDLERAPENDAVRDEEAIEGIVAQVGRSQSLHAHKSCQSRNGGVVRHSEVYVPSIEDGEISFKFGKNVRDLMIKFTLIE
jgi:hypothetical protein